MSSPLRVGILGFGSSARIFHIPFIQSLPELYTVVVIQSRSAPTPPKDSPLEKFHRSFPKVKLVQTYEEVAKDPDVDVICVCTPNETHSSVVKLALENNKHVIVEKPSFTQSTDAQSAFTLANERKRLIAVYQNRRFDSDFTTLKTLLSQNVFGDINELSTHYDRYSLGPVVKQWKNSTGPGHGILYDLGTHLIDQIIHLFGLPKDVSSPILRNVKGDGTSPDEMMIVLGYGDMNVIVRGTIISAMIPQVRFVVKGNKGTWVKHGLDPQEDQIKAWIESHEIGVGGGLSDTTYGAEQDQTDGLLTLVTEDGKFNTKPVPTEKGNYKKWYLRTYEALSQNDASKLVVSDLEAVNLLRLIELIIESGKQDGKRLAVPTVWSTSAK